MSLRAVVLGSAAGGGVPQWNCACPVCRLAWAGDARVRARTQASLAVSANGEDWLLLDVSPDIRQQILANDVLQPRGTARHSPIAAAILTSGDVDHVAGLLGLRERQGFALFATSDTLRSLDENRIFDVVAKELVTRNPVELGQRFEPLPELSVSLISVPGKVPLWREDETLRIGEETEATVAVLIASKGRRLAYVPGCATPSPSFRQAVAGVDLLFFDGTLWDDDEMVAGGLGNKKGRRMGHMPMSGPEGSLAALADLDVHRRVFIHINNTNRALIEGSAEHGAVETAGWTIAHDGMVFSV